MPSLARMLGLMLVFAGPLGLAAQTFSPRDQSAGPPSIGPGAMSATPPYRWAPQSSSALPATVPMRPDPYAGQVVPVSHQVAAAPFRQEPGYQPDASSPGYRLPENRTPEILSSGNGPLANRSVGNVMPSAAPAPVSLSPPGKSAGVPLSPPGRPGRNAADGPTGLKSLITAGGSLAVVLGIFFLVAWGMRRARPAGMTALPGEVFEVLGRAPMANRQQVHLLRCGSKLLLVCVTPAGTETLTEIVDPMEVDRLAGLCRQTHPGSATEAFRQVFKQFAPTQPDAGPMSRLFAGRGREDLSRDGLGMQMTPSELEDRNV